MSDIIEKKGGLIIAGLTPEQQRIYEETYGAFVSSLGGSAGRYITFGGKNFNVRENGQTKVITDPNGAPVQHLDLAVLNIAGQPHCIWYKDNYDPKNTDFVAPTAVWKFGERPDPSIVPDWVIDTKKIDKNVSYNHYQVKQRLVVARVRLLDAENVSVDLDTPYIMDLPSMSLFSKSNDKNTKLFTLQQMLTFWKKFDLFCGLCPVRMAFSLTISVPVPLMAPFTYPETGRPFLFPTDLQQRIVDKAFSQEVRQMLDVFARKPTPGAPAPAQAAPPRPAAVPEQVQTPAPAPAPAASPSIPSPPSTPPVAVSTEDAELLEAKSEAIKSKAKAKLKKEAAPTPSVGLDEESTNSLTQHMDSILDGVPKKP
jgi:hypothetical protein